MINRRLKRTVSTLALLIAAVVVWNVPMGNRETGKFVLKPLEHAEVRAPVAGFVTDVHYDEGESVSVGAAVVEMEVPELRSEIAQKRSQIEEVRAVLRALGADVPTGIETALAALDDPGDAPRRTDGKSSGYVRMTKTGPVRGKVHEIEAELAYARKRYEQAQLLNETKVVSDDRLRELNKNYQVWRNKRQEILSEQEAEKARLARLLEELTYLEDTREKLALLSPVEGIVTTPRLQALKGRYFEEGDLILEVVDPSGLEVEVTIGEQNLPSVRTGQRVVLKPFSLPYQTFEARVVRIAPVVQQPEVMENQATPQGSTGELKVYCELERPSAELTPGMSGYARIHLSDETFGNVVARRFMRFVRTEFWW
jgi:multidrug resistance efflux pump